MPDRVVQVDDEARDRRGDDRCPERRRQVASHPRRADIVSELRLQGPLESVKQGAIAMRHAVAAMLAVTTSQSVKRAGGSVYHCNAGNCRNTARVPSLHSLLKAVK